MKKIFEWIKRERKREREMERERGRVKRIDRIWLDEIISDEARQRDDGGKNGGQTWTFNFSFFFPSIVHVSR